MKDIHNNINRFLAAIDDDNALYVVTVCTAQDAGGFVISGTTHAWEQYHNMVFAMHQGTGEIELPAKTLLCEDLIGVVLRRAEGQATLPVDWTYNKQRMKEQGIEHCTVLDALISNLLEDK